MPNKREVAAGLWAAFCMLFGVWWGHTFLPVEKVVTAPCVIRNSVDYADPAPMGVP